jgi:hypothetical protein
MLYFLKLENERFMSCTIYNRLIHIPTTLITYSSMLLIFPNLRNQIIEERRLHIDLLITFFAHRFLKRLSDTSFFNDILPCTDLDGRVSIINTGISILSFTIRAFINNEILRILNFQIFLASTTNALLSTVMSFYVVVFQDQQNSKITANS